MTARRKKRGTTVEIEGASLKFSLRGQVATIDGPGVKGVIAHVEATGPGAGAAVAAFFGPLVGETFGADLDAALARRKVKP